MINRNIPGDRAILIKRLTKFIRFDSLIEFLYEQFDLSFDEGYALLKKLEDIKIRDISEWSVFEFEVELEEDVNRTYIESNSQVRNE